MEVSIVSSFSKIKKDWSRLFGITENVSPFLSPSAFEIAFKYYYPYYIRFWCRPVFIVFKECYIVRAIAPLLKYPNSSYKLFGEANGFNECGILYDTPSILPVCMKLLKDRLGDVEFMKIDERSQLANFAPPSCPTSSNVEIGFTEDYNEYFKTLSSSVRQNIRTAYNRLLKDGQNISVQTFLGGGIPVDEILGLYFNRHEERYGVKTSIFKRWFLKHQNFATRYYRYADNSLTVYLKINDQPAAFLSGLFHKERLIVPRLSINNMYYKYSPGMILVCETIKYLIASSTIRVLDLSIGEERYKYQLGGKCHLSYRFKL